VGRAVTAEVLEVNGVHHPERYGLTDGVTCLVRSPVYLEPFAAEAEHLRHERKCVESSVLVQRGGDLLRAAHLDPVTCAESERHGAKRYL
jgi:hypothetical protein